MRERIPLWLFSNIHSEFCQKQRNEALLSHYIKALLHGLIQMKPEALSAGEVIERYIQLQGAHLRAGCRHGRVRERILCLPRA